MCACDPSDPARADFADASVIVTVSVIVGLRLSVIASVIASLSVTLAAIVSVNASGHQIA